VDSAVEAVTTVVDRRLPLKLAGLVLGMFVFGFALVPLYDAFCAVTGFGGKTATAAAAVSIRAGSPANSRSPPRWL